MTKAGGTVVESKDNELRRHLMAVEIDLATKRIGNTSEDCLRWVLKFSRQNLDLLRPEERTALAADIRLLHAIPLTDFSTPDRRLEEQFVQPDEPTSDQELRGLQAEIAEGISALLSDPPGKWELPTRKAFLTRTVPPDSRSPRIIIRWEGDTRAMTIGRIVGLILHFGDRLRACPVCHTPFLSVRRQAYCSPACSQHERDRRKKAVKGIEANKEWTTRYKRKLRI
jgi:hypothetical protein